MVDSAAPRNPSGVQPPPLVGRDRERRLLREHLAAVLAGRGGLVLIGGEAGIGKTALAEALGAEAQAHGALVLVGRCYDLSETPPYGPWTELLEQLPALPDRPPPALVAQGGVGEGVASQAALFAQVRDYLSSVARSHRPLVLVLDDLHWADPASLELLRFLVRQLAPLPLLLLAIYRADGLTRRHPLYQLLPVLVREARAARLDLRRLDRDDLRELVGACYQLAERDEARLVAYLDEHAEGNPFYAGELLRSLEEEGALRPGDEGWVPGDLGRVRVPALLRQVVDGRLARLGEEVRELLEVAAVIGQVVPQDLWAAVSAVDEAALLTAVERAVEARLLEETPEGPGFRFAHALIREALYEGILAPRRRGWHRRVAEALAAGPSPDPDAVAYHFRQAGDARATEWLSKAGERAQWAYAWLTAAERFEAALALMEAQGGVARERGWLLFRLTLLRRFAAPRQAIADLDSVARVAVDDDRALAALARFHRGVMLSTTGEVRLGVAEMEAAIAAMEALPANAVDEARRPWLRRMGLPWAPDAQRAALALWLSNLGRYAEARALAQQILDRSTHATATGEPGEAAAGALAALAGTYAGLGRLTDARQAFDRLVEAYRAAGNYVMVRAGAVTALLWVALPYQADDLGERRRLVAEAEQAWLRSSGAYSARSLRHELAPLLLLEGQWVELRQVAQHPMARPIFRPLTSSALGQLARHQGDASLAWAQVRECLPAGPATEPGDTIFLHILVLQRLAAWLSIDAGDLPTARAWLAAHDRWLAWAGAVLGQAEGQLGWAAYHRAAGDLAQAREHAARSLACASEPRQPLALLAAHRLLGELNTAAGRHAEAAEHLAQALALADACAAPYERALTLLALAELRAATGRQAEARALLDEAHAIFTPLDAKPALTRADALAARIAPAPAAYPAGLSAREVEVLRLVAQGLSNAQVAERLHLSPRTVDQHLRSIYNKLGVSSRSAATRFALEHQLS